jgi:beta-galactosidase
MIKHHHIIYLLIFILFSFSFPIKSQNYPNIGAQIWIEPGQTKQEIDDWFKLAAQNKMYSARLFIMWNYIEKKSGQFDFTLYDWAFEAANKYGVKIEATLTSIHGPVHISQKFHGRPQFNELFASEEIMKRSAVYIDKTVNRYKNNKALGSWWILNEPRRFDPNSELATSQLQEWVKNKYKTIDKVNEAWIENYSGFSDIKYDPLWEKGSYFYWPTPSIDWYQFQRDFLTYNLQWIADEIRKYDKKHLITMNPANVFESAHQYDLPAYKKFNDVLGASMHASWQLRFMKRNQYGYAVAGISEILRGVAPEGKFWISELQGGNNTWSGKTAMCPDSLDLAQWIWTGIGSGARKVIYWALNYRRQGIEAGEWGLFGFRGEDTDRSRVTAKMNEIVELNKDFFQYSHPHKSKISLILSPETMRVLLHIDAFESGAELFDKNAHVMSIMMWFVAMSEMGYQVDIRYFNDYEWESDETGRIAILSNAIAIPSEVIPKMEKFVANNNKLVAEGLTGFFDEYETNTFIKGFEMENLLGGRMIDLRYKDTLNNYNYQGENIPAYTWKPYLKPITGDVVGNSREEVFAIRNKFGSGETLWIPPCFSLGAYPDNTKALSLLAHSEFSDVLHQQPFYFEKYTKGALMRILKSGNQYMTVVTNNEKGAIELTIVNNLNLSPKIIFGNNTMYHKGKVYLKERETLVLVWQ